MSILVFCLDVYKKKDHYKNRYGKITPFYQSEHSIYGHGTGLLLVTYCHSSVVLQTANVYSQKPSCIIMYKWHTIMANCVVVKLHIAAKLTVVGTLCLWGCVCRWLKACLSEYTIRCDILSTSVCI